MEDYVAGKRVYFPKMDREIHTLEETNGTVSAIGTFTFNKKGFCTNLGISSIPSIFHATEENKQLLDQLYPGDEEFQSPNPSLQLKKVGDADSLVIQRGHDRTVYFDAAFYVDDEYEEVTMVFTQPEVKSMIKVLGDLADE